MSCDCHGHPLPSDNTELNKKHRRALSAVLAINSGMVVVEAATGILSRSTAVITDMLEMASDSVGAFLARMGVKRSKRWQGGAALYKAIGMMALGLGVMGWVAFRIFDPVMPVAEIMTAVGGVAMSANAACVAILYRYRKDNINLKSTFQCVRNDTISNIGLIAAGVTGMALASPWPDIIVAAGVGGLFIKTATGMMRESIRAIKGQSEPGKGDACAVTAPVAGPENPKFAQRLKNKLSGIYNRKSSKDKNPPAPNGPHNGHPASPGM